MEDIVIRGSGGLAREVAFLIERINLNKKRWNLLGYVDMGDVGKIKYGYKVLGDDSWFQTEKNINCVIAIGLPMVRYKVYKSLELYSLSYPNIIDPSAIIAKDATLGIGNIITGPSRISVNVRIGDFCLLNGNCSLGHDVKIQDFVSIMTNTAISGNVEIGKKSFISVGSKVIPHIKVGQNVTLGVGSVVIKNIEKNTSVFGMPAKKIYERGDLNDD